MPFSASEWNVRTHHCVPMRYQNSSLRPSEMGCSSSRRKETPLPVTASGGNGMPLRALEGNVGTLHCVPMRSQNTSLRRVKWDAPHRTEGNPARPHHLGGKCDAPERIRVKCRNPSLRPNGMSELRTASEWNGCSSSHRKGGAHPLTASGGQGRASEHRSEMSEPSTASQ
jgi:hypothetical protein